MRENKEKNNIKKIWKDLPKKKYKNVFVKKMNAKEKEKKNKKD